VRILLFLYIVFIGLDTQISEDSTLRRFRPPSLKEFFIQREGQFISHETLLNHYLSPAAEVELRELINKGWIVKIDASDFGLDGMDFSFYCMPRRRLISEEISKEVSDMLCDSQGRKTGAWFIQLRNAEEFKQELINILSWGYFKFQGVISDNNLHGEYWIQLVPTLLDIYGDNLEKLSGRLNKILQRLETCKTSSEKIKTLEKILQQEREKVHRLKSFLNFYDQSQELKKIIGCLNVNIDEFKRLAAENGDVFVGFLIFGSWAYLLPSPDSDLDLILISNGELSVKSYNAIKDKLKELLTGRIKDIHCLTYPSPDLNNLDTFSIFNYPRDVSLYIRNFILITGNHHDFRNVQSLLLRYYYPHIFSF